MAQVDGTAAVAATAEAADRTRRAAVTDETLLEGIELPAMTPAGLMRHFGPGVILMMTGVGTSHLITAPAAGGRFGFALLWCVLVAYIFKYMGFEMAFRFTNATGRTLMDAYATAWRKWPLWYVLIATLLQCGIGQAGRLVAAAAVVYFVCSDWFGWTAPIAVYAFVLGFISVATILLGRYRALELTTKAMGAMLFVSAIVVYVFEPAPLTAFSNFFIIQTPEGSWLVVAALLGLLPTGIDVSLQASEWGKAKQAGMSRIRRRLEETGLAPEFDPFASGKESLAVHSDVLPPQTREYCRRWFRIGLWDFAIGHMASFVTACIFLVLAAVTLYPSPVDGSAVIGEIATMFTNTLGPGIMIVFIVGAFAALYSTAFAYFDGWPRVVAACARNLFRPTRRLRGTAGEWLTPEHRRTWYSEFNIYRLTMLYSFVVSGVIIVGLPHPVWLVLVASALAFFVSPVIYFLNLYYCCTVIPKDDPIFYPSPIVRWFGWFSFAVFTALTVITALV